MSSLRTGYANRTKAGFIGLLLFTLASLTSLMAQAPPSGDTFASSGNPKANYGSWITLAVQQGTTTYLQFNLGTVPAGATVSKATLRLYVDAVGTPGTFDVFQINSSWNENTLTFNKAPQPGASATGGQGVTVSSCNQFLLIDITPLVQGWVSKAITNNGVALAVIGDMKGNFSFDSKESLLTANGPELEIALSGAVGPQGPQGPQGQQGLQGATGAQGPQGSKGDTGAQGNAGPIGPQGVAGAQGSQGPKGDTGAQGPQGNAGPKGDTGAAGPTGPQGATGAQGAQGATGPQGPQGPIGVDGKAGAQGPQGPAGTGFQYRQAFDNNLAYAVNDVVTFNGSSYVALAATVSGDPAPDVNPSWSLMAKQGQKGDKGDGSGTITGVVAGPGLTGGGGSGNVTLNLDATKVVTGVTAGTGLSGGGTGGAVTLNLDTTKVPQLSSANTFLGDQSVAGNVAASGTITGGVVNASTSFNLGGNPFAFGSVANDNAFLGFAGNSTTTGNRNTASGVGALHSNTSGSNNTASGRQALLVNGTGNDNTASGSGALHFNTSGSNNTASGSGALELNATGDGNTASGIQSLADNSTGSHNTASGQYALSTNLTGSFNTALGYIAGDDVNHRDLNNTTAIGAFAAATRDNSLVLGSINGVNSATADTNVGIGITSPDYKLHIGPGNKGFRVEGPVQGTPSPLLASFGGSGDFAIDGVNNVGGRFLVQDNGMVGIGTNSPTNLLTLGQSKGPAIADGWNTYSSRRWKTNIHPLDNALAKVTQLRGVSYDLKESGKHEIGVIAEEVGAVVPEVVSFESNGKDARGVDYSRLTALLIEAVKQQEGQIREQARQIRLQQRAVTILRAQLRQRAAKEALLESRLAQLERGGEDPAKSVSALLRKPAEQSMERK